MFILSIFVADNCPDLKNISWNLFFDHSGESSNFLSDLFISGAMEKENGGS